MSAAKTDHTPSSPDDPGRSPRHQLVKLIRSRLARLFAGTFAAGLASRLILLATAVLLARQLSPGGYGGFTFATGAAALAAQFAGFGWPALLSRMVPTYRTQENWPKLRGLLRAADIIALGGGILAFIVIGTIALLPDLDATLASGLALTLVLVIPATFNFIRRSELAGAKRPAVGISLDEALPPAAVLTVALLIGVSDVTQAILIFAGAMVIGVLAATFYLRRALPGETWRAKPSYEFRSWTLIALPLLLGVSARLLMNRMDILMLGPLAGFEQVGYYGAAFRITYVLTFPQVIMMTVMTPLLSEAIAENKTGAMWRYFRIAMVFSGVTALPICLGLVAFSEPFTIFVFGADYLPSAGSLTILALAQVFSALAIPCAGLLVAAGRGSIFGVLNLVGVLLNATLNFLLIPGMGATGAALATLVSTAFIFVGQAGSIWRNQNNLTKDSGVQKMKDT